ncbi:MAG TPA: hypothetical protein PK722_09230, partial [Kiritimatiellia bacterium]|nr:hypothetical protein [Kiritimatiellia bacterium]
KTAKNFKKWSKTARKQRKSAFFRKKMRKMIKTGPQNFRGSFFCWVPGEAEKVRFRPFFLISEPLRVVIV